MFNPAITAYVTSNSDHKHINNLFIQLYMYSVFLYYLYVYESEGWFDGWSQSAYHSSRVAYKYQAVIFDISPDCDVAAQTFSKHIFVRHQRFAPSHSKCLSYICTVVLCFRSSRNSGQPQPSTSATQLERAESYGNDSTQAISVQDAINKFEHTTSSHLKGSTLISVLSLFPSSALTVFLAFSKLEKDL